MIAGSLQSGLDCNVLVLNKHYMAIRIIGARRAFSLLCRELAEVVSLEEDLQRTLGTKVRLMPQKKRGKIVIEYYSLDDLDRIIQLIKK